MTQFIWDWGIPLAVVMELLLFVPGSIRLARQARKETGA